MSRRIFCMLVFLVATTAAQAQDQKQKRYLYVAAPGIRNYLEHGGAGILVFDIDNNHKFVKRIKTPASEIMKPENIKGICGSAATKRLYFSTLTKLYCVDLLTEKTLWEKALPDGCDRMSITPDGKTLYVPTLEKDHWNIIDGKTGDVVTRIETKSRAHNTVVSLDGTRMYLAGINSTLLPIADPKTHKIVRNCGPFSAGIRPFTVNADQSLVFVNVNGLLGFEIGDLGKGEKVHRVEVKGFKQGPVKRHGCPSHGIGLTPDEKEIWICDGHNSHVHIFDNTVTPPKQVASVKLREQPGWVTFSHDGRWAWPSTGDVINVKTRMIEHTLTDEEGREVHSEKVVEIIWIDGVPVWVGDQFGLGRKGVKK